jgi:hypothetical protein
MGTERMAEFIGPCPCGEGILEIEHCSPDHGYSVSVPEWYETYVRCTVCSPTYNLQQFGKTFNLVAKSEVAQINAKSRECSEFATKLGAAAQAKGIMSAMVALLDNQTSAAAAYRIAAAAGLSYSSLPSFRKRWTGGAALVSAFASGYNVGKMLKVLKIDDPELQAAVANLEMLFEAGHAKCTPLQPAVHILI